MSLDRIEDESALHWGWRVERDAETWYRQKFPQARFLERGFRCKVGEIDLIFEEPPAELEGSGEGATELVFIEVRARLPGGWQTPLESVGLSKQRRLRRAISWYLSGYRGQAETARLDVLGWDGRQWQYFQNLWTQA
ncbi:YraN family protein [Bdellovibrionota bacterium FG-1]